MKNGMGLYTEDLNWREQGQVLIEVLTVQPTVVWAPEVPPGPPRGFGYRGSSGKNTSKSPTHNLLLHNHIH